MKDGLPTHNILPFSEVTLDPDDVNISADGSVATSFVFMLSLLRGYGNQTMLLLLLLTLRSISVYISRVGENDLLTQTFISNQPYLGSLFKSQNASAWEPSQWEDLKFNLYRADFADSGSVEFTIQS